MGTIYTDKCKNKIKKPADASVNWRMSCYALVENKGKILFVVPTWDTSRYDLPGGGVEINESIEQGLKREVWEESGYKIYRKQLAPIDFSEGNLYSTRKKIFFHSVKMVFLCELAEKQQYLEAINPSGVPAETERVEWVDIKNLKNINMNDDYQKFIIDYFKSK